MADRTIQLEEKFLFLEQDVSSLDEVVRGHGSELDVLRREIDRLRAGIAALHERLDEGAEDADELDG